MTKPMNNEVGSEVKAMPINNGIAENERREIAESLERMLADTFTLYLKTLNFHWNVTGPMFQPLHAMFEHQYTELAGAVDQIAERIRALGFPSPGTYQEFAQLTSIRLDDGAPTAEEMIRSIVEGHETVTRTARSAFKVADKSKDEASVDLLTERLQIHEKTAWMMRSLLARSAAASA